MSDTEEVPAHSIVITGGTSGIGLATAELLHGRGFRVMVTGRNAASVAAASDRLPDDVVVVQADSRSIEDAGRLAHEVRTRFGELTALFLNAGVTRSASVTGIDESTYDEVFDTNTRGHFFTLQKLLPVMADGGSVVITAGVGIAHGRPGASVTAGSRGALLAMVPSLAVELAPRRIRVNAVSPGAIDTPIWHKAGVPAETVEAMTASIPFGRLGTGRDVAGAVAFLVGPDSVYVTGQDIAVSGGIEI